MDTAVLKYISLYRSQLMAFAIIGVLFVHSGIHIPNAILNGFVGIGYGGVDLFFFLSGFGLFFSCQKDNRWSMFCIKRLKRILPAFVICILITQLVVEGKINWSHLWQDCLFIGYWIPQLKWHFFAWFISGIMGLYLIFPFYYRIFKKYPRGATIHASLLGICCAMIYSYYFLVLYPKGCNALILLLARTPIFFLGVFFAWLYNKETVGQYRLSKEKLLLLTVLPFVGYKLLGIVATIGLTYNQMRNSGGTFYPFILIVPGFAISLGYMISKLPRILQKTLSIIGGSTLEAYCLIGCVFHFRPYFEKYMGGNIPGCMVMMAVCVIIAIGIHYLVSFATKCLSWLMHKE